MIYESAYRRAARLPPMPAEQELCLPCFSTQLGGFAQGIRNLKPETNPKHETKSCGASSFGFLV